MSKAITEHRRRLTERGLKRVELVVAAPDVALLRRVVKVLTNDGDDAERLRLAMQKAAPTKPTVKFKDWLESLPDEEA